MSERTHSFLTYIIVFFLLLFTLAIISPTQFQALIDAFSQTGELALVLIAIAIVVYFLRRVREL